MNSSLKDSKRKKKEWKERVVEWTTTKTQEQRRKKNTEKKNKTKKGERKQKRSKTERSDSKYRIERIQWLEPREVEYEYFRH